jgi:soluble lytic murein transglycosylase-like protein
MSSLLRAALCAAALLLITLSVPTAASARSYHSRACANRLCTKDSPKVRSCRSRHGRPAVSRCFITRAARHFRQPRSLALYIAHRESRFNPRVTNASSGAAGLYQFMPRTWQSTPYRHHSPYQPRWAALAAMWMWARGGYYHWRV